MKSRRSFFKDFLGQVGVLHDEIRGVENIPLNRLIELPNDIVDEIVPVFFPDQEWEKRENVIYLTKEKNKEQNQIQLSQAEELAFDFLLKGLMLKKISLKIESQLGLPYDEAYQIVTSLFFSLSSKRICHPREVYDIEALSKSKTE